MAQKAESGRSAMVDPKKLLTIAALPGTTLGLVAVDGIMRKGCQVFDTPGVPHPFQLTSILTGPEVKLNGGSRRVWKESFSSTAALLTSLMRSSPGKDAPSAATAETQNLSYRRGRHRFARSRGAHRRHGGKPLPPPPNGLFL